MSESVTYPCNERYTLQWLKKLCLIDEDFVRGKYNTDATFKKGTQKRKPSDLLLHYNYGAAAVKWWGRGVEVFQSRLNCVRPPTPAPALVGRTSSRHDRAITVQDRGETEARDGPGEMLDTEAVQTRWDEDDVMLFFWGNSRGATERYRKKQEESIQKMERWRQGVP